MMMAYFKLAGFLLMIVAGQICFKKAALSGAGLGIILAGGVGNPFNG